MAAPAFETAATNTGSGTSLTINKPSGTVSGDLLVVALAGEGASSATWSLSGWTVVRNYSDLGSVGWQTNAVMYKQAGGSEPSSYSFSATASQTVSVGGIIRISGVDSTAPVAAATYTEVATGSLDPPSSGSVTADDYLAVAVAARGDGASQTPPTNYTERVDVAATGENVSLATRALTAATSEDPGAFGSVTYYPGMAATILVTPADAIVYHAISPTDDVTTTGWTSTPLWSKVDDDPDSPDATVITATAS